MTSDDEREDVLIRSDALERVSDGVVALDTDFRYTYVNQRAEEILGKDTEELLGERIWDVFPGTTGSGVRARIEESMAGQRRASFEQYSDDLDRWFDVRLYPDENGVSIYFTDVTERKAFERDLERTNRQLTALVENTDVAVYSKDCEGRYRLMNEPAAALFGLDPEEAVGRRDEELFDAESAAAIREIDERIVERGASDTREAVRYVDGERHVFLDDKFPHRDEDGEVVGVMGISRDVTERKRSEQELRALSEEYETIFEHAEDAIFLVDVETAGSRTDESGTEGGRTGGSGGSEEETTFRFERLSPSHEATSGLSTEEVRGKTPREALDDEFGGIVEANYRRCVEAREPITYEEEIPMPEGRIVWQTKLAPVVVDGEVTRIVGIARDVTDRVEQERELRRKNDRLDEFASVISHDLRNPLTVAKGRAALLGEECESAHLPPIERALDRMEAIVEDTLTLARQGETVAETEPVALVDLAGRCWATVDTAGATLEIRDECTVRGDPDRLQQVCENLVRNAVEHGGDDVHVRIGRLGEDGLYLEDDGTGIPEAEREAVFEPGHSSATGGTGFGLTIVKRIAEAHGWTVAVTESEAGGARFEFRNVELVR